jgi:hypothetical protein
MAELEAVMGSSSVQPASGVGPEEKPIARRLVTVRGIRPNALLYAKSRCPVNVFARC